VFVLRGGTSPCGHDRRQIGRRDENAQALAPDDYAPIVLQVDARWDRIALAALEGAQTSEIDEHHIFQIERCADRRLEHDLLLWLLMTGRSIGGEQWRGVAPSLNAGWVQIRYRAAIECTESEAAGNNTQVSPR
jgi:hypothetical protein